MEHQPGRPLGFGAALTHWSGYDVLAARDATSPIHHVSTVIVTGLMIGMVGTITGHELTHRTWDPISMLVGRWLLAFSFDTVFAIEHVYGHHRYVSTTEDPQPRRVAATCTTTWWHRPSRATSALGALSKSAWLAKAGPVLVAQRGHSRTPDERVAGGHRRGHGWLASGLFFTACGLWGKSLLEIVNYMEHYGMVRNPATPVQPRHSWNTNKRISSWAMFNLTRHSHHHAQGEVPYQDLKPFPDAPMMINGYLTTIIVAMIPPLWHKLMTPKVLAWDRDYATAEERMLAAQTNARSGIAEMQALVPGGAPASAVR